MFYGFKCAIAGSRDKKELVFVIPVGSPFRLIDKQIRMCFGHIKPCKALGPDGLRGHVLKVCVNELPHRLTCKPPKGTEDAMLTTQFLVTYNKQRYFLYNQMK